MKFKNFIYQESREGDYDGYTTMIKHTSINSIELTKLKVDIIDLTDENVILLKENKRLKERLDSLVKREKIYI